MKGAIWEARAVDELDGLAGSIKDLIASGFLEEGSVVSLRKSDPPTSPKPSNE